MICGIDHLLSFNDSTPEVVCPSICLGWYPPLDWDYSQNIGANYFFSSVCNSATISDKAGNLLFYANGETIYHRNFDTLWSTNTIYPYRRSATQSIFIPKPNNANRYYYFTPPGIPYGNGIRYTELDVSLNNGIGGIVGGANHYLTGPSTNKVTATYHANGSYVWVLMHQMESNLFKAYLITESGISSNPTISAVGSVHTNNGANSQISVIGDASAGQMKFSPTGKYLACALDKNNKIEVFYFNNLFGTLTLIVSIDLNNAYSVEFSPDETLLYFSSHHWNAQDSSSIYQMDLISGNSTQIQNSIVDIAQNEILGLSHNILQATYTGEIIVSDYPQDNILRFNRIKFPNQPDTSCHFNRYFFSIPPFSSNCNQTGGIYGLTSFFPPYLDRNILFANACINDTVLICTQTNTNFDSIRWEFNDYINGIISIPDQDTIYYVFPTGGFFEVFLKRYRNGYEDIVRKILQLYPKVDYSYPGDTLLCPGQALNLTCNGNGIPLAWVNNLNSDTLFSDSILISAPGIYWPIAPSYEKTCYPVDSIHVFYQQDNLNLGQDSFHLCSNPGILLDASVNDSTVSFLWNTGDTSSVLQVNENGIYSVAVQQGSCLFQDTVTLYFDDSLTIALPDSVVLCEGSGIWLDAGDYDAEFLWSPGGQTSMMIWADSTGLYSVTVSNGCGDFADTTEFIVPDIPIIELGPDTAICEGTSLVINALFPHSSFLWNTGSANSYLEATQAGVYAVTVSNICGTAIDSIEVITDDSLFIELGADTAICLETNFMLQSSQAANQYLWSTGESSQTIAVLQTGTYWLEAFNACNSSSDTIHVIVNENTFAFAQDTLSLDSSLVLQLEAPIGYQSYRWSTSDTTQSISVTSPGNYWLQVTDSLGCTASDTIVVLPYISSPEQSLSTIRIYPNPTTGELFLDGLGGGESIEIYDILGKSLLSAHSEANTLKLNLSEFSMGVYFLSIQTQGKIYTYKILKE